VTALSPAVLPVLRRQRLRANSFGDGKNVEFTRYFRKGTTRSQNRPLRR
jgi:hypothetical protein